MKLCEKENEYNYINNERHYSEHKTQIANGFTNSTTPTTSKIEELRFDFELNTDSDDIDDDYDSNNSETKNNNLTTLTTHCDDSATQRQRRSSVYYLLSSKTTNNLQIS